MDCGGDLGGDRFHLMVSDDGVGVDRVREEFSDGVYFGLDGGEVAEWDAGVGANHRGLVVRGSYGG